MLKNIFLVVLLLVLIYIVIQILNPSNKISSMQDGWVETIIDSDKLKENKNSNNFTYSLWFYVNDWNYRFDKPKILLDRPSNSPKITLGAMQNDIDITLNCYPTSGVTGTQTSSVPHTCNIKNFPLQKWINLVISLQNQTLDIYLDGKLHKTCLLAGVPIINSESLVYITPKGGFNGWTSNFQYWDEASNPQQVYNIYKKGYGGGALGNIFNRYKFRFQFLKDNKVAQEVVI
tara:strand:+ start:110 stop:805 length:696 start_codon:yes stop_codon:yes gene_type:complete